ncbi:MAG TPA: thioesterase family protein [Anaerolineales bacterium]
MPEFRFFHPVEVRYGDLDAQGHVNNAKFLTYFEQARVRYWTELGLFATGQSFAEIGVIIADIHIRYEQPLHWGTAIKVGAAATRIGNKSLTMEQCVVEASGLPAFAAGTVVLVAYDYAAHATMRVPDVWRERLEHFEGRKLD